AGGTDVALVKYSGANGAHLWSKRFGGLENDSIDGVALDASGNVVIGGLYCSTIDLGAGLLDSVGVGDMYLAKFNSAGSHQWSKSFISGTSARDCIKGVTVDSQGNVIIAGCMISALSFGGAALTNPAGGGGSSDTFVAKFSAAGSHLWSNRYGGYFDDWACAVTVDRTDNLFVIGQFYGSMQFGAGEQVNTGGYDGYIAKFAP